MKTKLLFFVFFLGCLGLQTQRLFANNIQISTTPTVVVTNDSIRTISFNLTWDNSWKSGSPRNWDAAWVFCKFSLGGSGWDHVYLVDTSVDKQSANWHRITSSYGAVNGGAAGTNVINTRIVPGKSEVPGLGSVPVGLFIYRKDMGYGSMDLRGVTLKWNYKAQGYSEDDPISVKVFAIEMVYCAGGAFYLGDFGTSARSYKIGGATTVVEPYYVTSEDSIVVANPAGLANEGVLSTMVAFAQLGNIPAEYPKGYKAFYIMKHELTQEAYADFLNTLGFKQQTLRQPLNLSNPATIGTYLYPTTAHRNGLMLLSLKGAATFACNLVDDGKDGAYVNKDNDGQNIPMNYMSLADAMGYLAWAGLRPLTELEFEKAARGTRFPAPGEYAWGNSSVTPCGEPQTTATRKGEAYEKPDKGNCNYAAASPLRVGAFADSVSTRIEAGAAYWGAMEMSGNVAERYVNAEYTIGRAFTGKHGYGFIDLVTALPPASLGWPEITNSVDPALIITGYTNRGGGYAMNAAPATTLSYTRISDRAWTGTFTGRVHYAGCRGGRTENATE